MNMVETILFTKNLSKHMYYYNINSWMCCVYQEPTWEMIYLYQSSDFDEETHNVHLLK